MYTIRLDFQRFSDIDLRSLIGAVGVYVIWDARAKARPTYIGEGTILRRFAQHVTRDGRRFAQPWNGYVAVISGSTSGVHKDEVRIAERALLDVAFHSDRLPRANKHPGNAAIIRDSCKTTPIRIVVSGYDPLSAPKNTRPLTVAKRITIWHSDIADYVVEADWRLRRLGRPIIAATRWSFIP